MANKITTWVILSFLIILLISFLHMSKLTVFLFFSLEDLSKLVNLEIYNNISL